MRNREGNSVRNVRFAPERSGTLSRQRRILRAESIIEVPKDMYSRGRTAELE